MVMTEQEGAGRPRKYDLKDLFQQAFELKMDDSLIIACRDYKEMERIRIAFYREWNKLRKLSSDLADEIQIRRVIKDNYHAVTLSRLPVKGITAFILTGEGKVKEISSEDKELERIERLMKDDGYSDEEIKTYKKSQEEAMPEIGGEDENF